MMAAAALSLLLSAPVGDLLQQIDGKEWEGQFAPPAPAGARFQAEGPKLSGTAAYFARPEGEHRFVIIDVAPPDSSGTSHVAAVVVTFREEGGLLRGQIDEIMPGRHVTHLGPAIGVRNGNKLSFVTSEAVIEAGMRGPFWLVLELDEAPPRFSFGIESADGTLKTLIAGTFR